MGAGSRLKSFLFFLADAAALYAALFITLLIRYGMQWFEAFEDAHAFPFTIIFIFWIGVFYIAGLYDLRRLRNSFDFLKTLFLSIGVSSAIAVLLFYLVPALGIAPKTNLAIFIVIFTVIEIFWRRVLNRAMAFGEAPNRVLFVGDGAAAKEVARTVRDNPQLGYDIKAEIDEKEAYAAPAAIAAAAERERVNLIVISNQLKQDPQLVAVLYDLFGRGVLVTDTVSFYELVMRRVPLAEIEHSWFLENLGGEVRFYDPLKRAFEFMLALAIGIVLLPVELVIALLVKLTSRGPIIYRQERVGAHGRTFMLYKFRSMRTDAESAGAQWSAGKHDTRTTPIGGMLRASHLDELPQLWNIIRGDISFVGPRPERPEFVEQLRARIPYYEARLFVKPGVTGWAQIHHHADRTDEDVAQKLQYDIYYLKNRSPILDSAIVLKTLKSIFVNPE
jgi:exopolysaccharide biosynthesis polyprenyl glycosylphosphotransferase